VSGFAENELAYLATRRLAHIATVGPDGTPHVVPVGSWRHNAELDVVEVTGPDVPNTKWFRDAVRSGLAAFVVDDLTGPEGRTPRAVEVRGRAEAAGRFLRIHPDRVVSWGL
jgi:pyridoxamine 5'-phosphate oxidase family protein